MKKIITIVLFIMTFLVGVNANAHTIVVSNLSAKKTNALINKMNVMYQSLFDPNETTENIKQFFTKNYVLYSNSQKQNLTQLIQHLEFLHKNYKNAKSSPFEIIQITNNFITLKYQVYLTNDKKSKAFNYIAIYHFNHNKIDKTWEVASPISAQNIH